jgi:hypothetical protein
MNLSSGAQPGSAMTAVALALAMAFFAVMLLTLISMGAGRPTAGGTGAGAVAAPPERLAIYHGGELLNSRLRPFDTGRLSAGEAVVLTVPPGLSFTGVTGERRRFPAAAPGAAGSTTSAPWSAGGRASVMPVRPARRDSRYNGGMRIRARSSADPAVRPARGPR